MITSKHVLSGEYVKLSLDELIEVAACAVRNAKSQNERNTVK